MKFIRRKHWRKSSAAQYQPEGGYFVTVNTSVLDLNLLFDDFINQFNENSISIYLPSGYVTLDEILSKAKSRRNALKQYNATKKDKLGILFHILNDSNSNFCVKINLKMPKQFADPSIYKTEGLCKFFLRNFEHSFVVCCQDNFFNSFDLSQSLNEKGIYCFGTVRRQVIQRYFSDHLNGIGSYFEPKHSKVNSLKCFTHDGNNHPVRYKTHLMIHNPPSKNSVIFISNSNSIMKKSSDNINDIYRQFVGGNYSRDLTEGVRPMVSHIYNEKMGACDTFDVYVHRFSLRFLPLKNKYCWILKPVLNILEFQFINSFMVYRESHPSPNMDYRIFLLRIAQGLVKNSPKPAMAPLRVRGNELFPRNFCRDCKDVSPRKDCRTSKTCSKCGAGCCRNHSKIVCSRCFS